MTDLSQRCTYNGHLFRSVLEADYAMTFDALGIQWQYEPMTFRFPELKYRPDFFLPQSRQWVEVKGVFQPTDCRKILVFTNHQKARPHTATDDPCTNAWCPDIPIVTCTPGGQFIGYIRPNHPYRVSDRGDFFEFLRKQSRVVELYQCGVCLGWWFCDPDASWRCQCCGAYDGDGHLLSRVSSPFEPWPMIPRESVA